MNQSNLGRRDFLKTVGLGSAWVAHRQILFADEAGAVAASPPKTAAGPWPVLQRYQRPQLARIAMPLGGIGTGTVSLGGRGDLRDWEIMNRPAKGHVPNSAAAPFVALYLKTPGGQSFTRTLEAPLDFGEYEGSHGSTAPNHGLPRFHDGLFAAAYPLAQVLLLDPDIPVEARLEAFNPLVPADPEASGLPVAVLRYALHNRNAHSLRAAVCANLPNFIGNDGWETRRDWKGEYYPVGEKDNHNFFREGSAVRGIFMNSSGVDPRSPAWGTLALTTTASDGVSYRTDWLQRSWGGSLLDFWDDFSADGVPEQRENGADAPMASLAVQLELPPRTTRYVTFLIAWHFPNRRTWTPANPPAPEDIIGNYYTTQFSDAWDAAEKTAANLPEYERRTVNFVRSFCESDLPHEVKEAALFNLSTLRSQTCFRTPDGRFFGYEGCCNKQGCCHGSCTHVWNYEQATAFLFGNLALTMREVEFEFATNESGLMSFRTALPLERARQFGKAAADGQMGCIMKMYRDWQLSGDDDSLRRLWPKVRRALEFCWIPGGWDADADGVMEGCQHNTMDVEYYGPNPQMGFWYLGALKAAEKMAAYLGENDFAESCRRRFENGSRWLDANLFNGEYYEHEIRIPRDKSQIAPPLLIGMGAKDPTNPDFQLGEGCLVDQLVGQFMAHVCNLGYLGKPENIRTCLQSILKYNQRSDMTTHFNNMRSFALGEEKALLMASFPKKRPRFPFPYFPEAMTGFEYVAAVGLLYEGNRDDGLACIRHIRNRYNGRKRSPFNEAECGHHYARAMASWAAVLACTGFSFSAISQTMAFSPHAGNHFWSTGHAWGTCRIQSNDAQQQVELAIAEGRLTLREFSLHSHGRHTWPTPQNLNAGDLIRFNVNKSA